MAGQQKPWEKYGAPQGPVTLGTPNPVKGQTDAVDLTLKQQRAALAPYDTRKSAADATKAEAEAYIAKQKADEARATETIQAMGPNSNVHGEAYLRQFVPPAQWDLIRAYARGDLGARAGGLSTSMLPIIQHAMNYDPTASGVNFPAKVKMQSDLASGDPKSLGGGLQAFERMLLHGENVLDKGLALNNFHSGLGAPINYLRRAGESFTQDPTLSAFDEAVRNYAPESQKAIAQTAGGQEERQGRAAAFSGSMSPEAISSGLQSDATQALGAMKAANDRYKRLMGKDILDIMSPEAKRAYDKIMSGGYDPAGNALHPAADFVPISPNSSGPPPATGNGPPTLGPTGSLPPGGMPPGSFRGGPTVDKTSNIYDPTGGGTGGGTGLAQGNYKTEFDPIASRQLDGMIRSGWSADRINAALVAGGRPALTPDAMANVGAAQAYLKIHPDYKGSFANSTKSAPISSPLLNQFQQSAPGVFADQFANGATFGNKANLASLASGENADLIRGGLAMSASEHPYAATAGNLSGGAATAGGLELGLGGLAAKAGIGATPWVARGADALYGGISGATADPEHPITGALLGAGLGAGGGMFGRATTRGAGNALTGVRNEAVQMLNDRGIPLTVGQALSQSGLPGRFVKGMEDKMTSVPGIGDMINARRIEGLTGFDRAAFDEGLAPIGGSTGGVIREPGIDLAQQATHQGYGTALNGVQVTPDAQFSQELGNSLNLGGAIPRVGPEFTHIANAKIAPHFNSPTGVIDGPQIQDILQTTRKTNFGNDAMGSEANDALAGIGSSVEGLVGRQSPGTIPALGNANAAYRNTKILQAAVDKARNGGRSSEPGLFVPSELADAASANSRRFGGTQGTTNQPFFDLARIGQAVLPSKVPDSGTSGRLAAMALPSALGGTGAALGAISGDTKDGAGVGLGVGLLAGLGGSRAGQQLLTKLLLDRPDLAIRVGQQIQKRAGVSGMFGAGATPLLLPQQ